jgi:peptide/nickel transport system permease protein
MIRLAFDSFRLVLLPTDLLLFLLLFATIGFLLYARRREYYRVAWRQIVARPFAMACMGVCLLYASVALLDSVRYQKRAAVADGSQQQTEKGDPVYRPEVLTLLDLLCSGLRDRTETTFSAPFATRQFTKETIEVADGKTIRGYPRLKYGGASLADPEEKWRQVVWLALRGIMLGIGVGGMLIVLAIGFFVASRRVSQKAKPGAPVRSGLRVGGLLAVLAVLAGILVSLSAEYHVLGTDQVGQDVLYRSLKGCRVGLVVGTLTTLIATPLAILFGIMAGYFGGRIDDIIQYLYTTLDSIPSILLIAAAMLIVTTRVEVEQAAVASDTRLLLLCVVLGIGSWTGLCRLLRGETLKVRENEYVEAAEAFGVSRAEIMFRHLLPNVMHIVLISIILRFSGLVLAEAVLAYVGIGVDPSMESWGNMINAARLDISRDPIVWWNLLAAFLFMFGLVLPANIFGDAVRDALDPRLKTE